MKFYLTVTQAFLCWIVRLHTDDNNNRIEYVSARFPDKDSAFSERLNKCKDFDSGANLIREHRKEAIK